MSQSPADPRVTLVLLSVFVPTAFIPGITGQLYNNLPCRVGFVINLGDNALTLARIMRVAARGTAASPRTDRVIFISALQSRDGYAAVVRPLARRVLLPGHW